MASKRRNFERPASLGASHPALPPGRRRGSLFLQGLLQAPGDPGRYGSMHCVMPQHFIHSLELLSRLGLLVLLRSGLLLFLLLVLSGESFWRVHGSGGLLKDNGEGFASPVEFAPDRVGALRRERGYLVVAQLLVGDEQEQQPVFRGERVQRLLNAFAQFFGFQDAEG